MAIANLHKPTALKEVFTRANFVFSVTEFETPYTNLTNQARAKEPGEIGRYAYKEMEQRVSTVDAVVDKIALDTVGLNVSTLRHAHKCSE